MTREEASEELKKEFEIFKNGIDPIDWENPNEELRKIIEANTMAIKALEREPKIGHCKDCKWWKDSDGAFRRGIGAESQCPMNRIEVYEGNGYCFLYEPRAESEEEE